MARDPFGLHVDHIVWLVSEHRNPYHGDPVVDGLVDTIGSGMGGEGTGLGVTQQVVLGDPASTGPSGGDLSQTSGDHVPLLCGEILDHGSQDEHHDAVISRALVTA